MDSRPKTVFLFDVDGTLTKSRLRIDKKTKEALKNLRSKVYLAFVGGSDLNKQKEQVGDEILELFDFSFPENGVVFYKGEEIVSSESVVKFLGEDVYKSFVNFSLKYLAEMDLPIKRGTFIELRTLMINLCPIGRNCSQEERLNFFENDKKFEYRKKMVDALRNEFDKFGLQFSIGGQISIDVFPKGWDKTYCLQHLKDFENIIFFGDMVNEGGNDYEIFIHEKNDGVKVTGPEEIEEEINEKLKEYLK